MQKFLSDTLIVEEILVKIALYFIFLGNFK